MSVQTKNKSVTVLRVYEALREGVSAGKYPGGTWLPAERLLATEFGVDRDTIRNALTRMAKENIIVRERGKRPRVSEERSVDLRSNSRLGDGVRPLRVAVILPQHPDYRASAAILFGMNRGVRELEYPPQLVIFDTYETPRMSVASLEEHALSSVMADRLDGAIFWYQSGAPAVPLILQCEDMGIPIVFIDRQLAGIPCDFVGIDNEIGTAQAIDHLLSLGHRRIAHLTTCEDASTVHDRERGYRSSLERAGITPRAEWLYRLRPGADLDIPEAVESWLSLDQPPTAVFAMNDVLAHRLVIALEQHGIRIPNQMSVVGFDDLEQYSPRPALLTTVHQPFDSVGKSALNVLMQRLNQESQFQQLRQHIFLPTSLVVRTTTDAPRDVRDPETTRGFSG